MAKTKVVYSDDATTIIFNGDPRYPESSTGIIKFPGGHVEVCRTKDNDYWAHISVDKPSNTIDSRIDFDHEGWVKNGIIDVPDADKIMHLAVRIAPNYVEPTGE